MTVLQRMAESKNVQGVESLHWPSHCILVKQGKLMSGMTTIGRREPAFPGLM